MIKQIGRLDPDTILEIETEVNDIFRLLDSNEEEEAQKKLNNIAKTPNYFVREYFGKLLTTYDNQERMLPILKRMLKHRMYGIRATALFYISHKYVDQPEMILDILSDSYTDAPWEAESIVNDLWKNFPVVMKRRMPEWVVSDDEKKRAMAFHGIENIAEEDPFFIMDFISKVLDDDSIEVQKKITHVLTQVARTRPAECYPYIREWLLSADEKRIKTLWVSMKKLVNIVSQKSKREKTQDFVTLTKQTISDWRKDEDENVSDIGNKLYNIVNNKK